LIHSPLLTSETSACERPASNLALRTTPLVHPAELVERAEIDTQLHTARNVGQALALSSAFGKNPPALGL
jgi:hypothetical protein